MSQHELLYRLSKNKNAFVYYACPMLFEKTDLYRMDVDFDKLRLVELDSCPAIYEDNDNHFIYFDAPDATPIWRSEPHEGRAISPKDFVRLLSRKFADLDGEESREILRDLLTDLSSLGVSEEAKYSNLGRDEVLFRLPMNP